MLIKQMKLLVHCLIKIIKDIKLSLLKLEIIECLYFIAMKHALY